MVTGACPQANVPGKQSYEGDDSMKNSTLCYIEEDGKYLMLYRNKKENDPNEGKWIGIGGIFEEKESPVDCLVREVKEETGLTLINWKLRGIVTFISDVYETEYMYIFTSNRFEGEVNYDCSEGTLKWVRIADVPSLPLWEGDRAFLRLMDNDSPFFLMKLIYKGDVLMNKIIE